MSASNGAADPASASDNSKTYWIPLESNPDVLTEFAQALGLPGGVYRFSDVWGLDESVLDFVPRPVLAVVILFPITDSYESHRKQQDALLASSSSSTDPSLVFFRQTIGNACGTIGLLHALANNMSDLGIEKETALAKIVEQGNGKTAYERGKLLEKSSQLSEIHAKMGGEGQTEAPAADSDVNLHFVAFVKGSDGHVYELDGRRERPVDHGEAEDLLVGAAKVLQGMVEREQGNLSFSMLALCPDVGE